MGTSTGTAVESRDPWLSPAFVGVARLPLETLNFEHGLFKKQHRPVSEKVVRRLQTIFRREGIVRTESKHWIDALVDHDNLHKLDQALVKNRKRKECLRLDSNEHPFVNLGPVDCLQGVHRILAASDILNPNDRWWPVRLYSQEALPQATKIKIIEGSVNEQPYSDGEIFRKIRAYHKDGNINAEAKWWARLTPTKQNDLRQLLKNPSFAKAFDDLVDMPGLWYSVKLGTLHRLLTLRCDEELLRYLQHIKRTWKGAVDAAGILPGAVDRATVEKLELLAPSASENDRRLIEVYMSSGNIFPAVSSQLERKRTLRALTAIPGLIPSLKSFFENLKYLEPCSIILKRLFSPKEKRTIFQSLSRSYFKPSKLSVEFSEGKNRTSKAGDTDETGLWLAYVQLWAFCMRHFPAMTQIMPRKESGKGKPSVQSNPALWHYLGDLAVNLGFKTENAENLRQQDPYRSLAEQSLKNIRPDPSADDQLIGKVADALRQADSGPARVTIPKLTREQSLSRERRCNRPFEDDFAEDTNSLFIPLLYVVNDSHGADISPFFVKRDIFLNFLGNKYGQLQPSDGIVGEDDEGGSNDIIMGGTMDSSTLINGADNSRMEVNSYVEKLQEDLHMERREREGLQAQCKNLETSLKSLQDEKLRLEKEMETLRRVDEGLENNTQSNEQEVRDKSAGCSSHLGSESSTPVYNEHPDAPNPQDDLKKAYDVMKELQLQMESSDKEFEHLNHELNEKRQEVKKLMNDLENEKQKLENYTEEWNNRSLELEKTNQALELAINAWKKSNAGSIFKSWLLLVAKANFKNKVANLEAAHDQAMSQINERKKRDEEEISALRLQKEELQERVKQSISEKDQALEEARRLQKVLQHPGNSLKAKDGDPSDSDQARKGTLEPKEQVQHEAKAREIDLRSLEEEFQALNAHYKALEGKIYEMQEGLVLVGVMKLFQVAIEQFNAFPRDFLAFFTIRMHYAEFIVPVPREGAEPVVDAVIQAVTDIGLADRADVEEEDGEKWIVAFQGKTMPKSYWTSPQYVMRCIETGIGFTLGPKSVVITALANDSDNTEGEIITQIVGENGKKRGVILKSSEHRSSVAGRQYVRREIMEIEEADEDEDRYTQRKLPSKSQRK